ncbi:uncharacterized protein LOC111704448 [Eurytemora carolleeae]|uniref:uncharacterized protein LOC111704448 n=1 Tax=Eurytemora carolleeae TaxID=1294199 RepID=UPI000C77114D|nr:uncharacterized protein LOC111704448 [Eurytemora carolleeae]|eukprot:XP_023332452.1 uncharacterized protein LOC111704448 [Eurytemora affinis]
MKSVIKTGTKPLVQLVNRIVEKKLPDLPIPQEPPIKKSNIYLYKNQLLEILKSNNDDTYVVRVYQDLQDAFTQPFPSRLIGKYQFNSEDYQEDIVSLSKLRNQGFKITVNGLNYFHLLLHHK